MNFKGIKALREKADREEKKLFSSWEGRKIGPFALHYQQQRWAAFLSCAGQHTTVYVGKDPTKAKEKIASFLAKRPELLGVLMKKGLWPH